MLTTCHLFRSQWYLTYGTRVLLKSCPLCPSKLLVLLPTDGLFSHSTNRLLVLVIEKQCVFREWISGVLYVLKTQMPRNSEVW